MQRLKLTVLGFLIPLVTGVAFAAPTTALPSPVQPAVKSTDIKTSVDKKIAAADVHSPEENVVTDSASIQNYIKEMVEEDYNYEKARRQLKSELEMEKMRSEIRKLRGEGKNKQVTPAVAPASAENATEEKNKPSQPIPSPRVVFDSQIGGLSRVAIVSGDNLKYVKPGEIFAVDGYNFRLSSDRKSVLLVGNENK